MKTISGNKYIRFELRLDGEKTQVWGVVNEAHGNQLGVIRWYQNWRQYVFEPKENCIFNDTCLESIRGFLNRINIAKKL